MVVRAKHQDRDIRYLLLGIRYGNDSLLPVGRFGKVALRYEMVIMVSF